jgi:hypothetical protein
MLPVLSFALQSLSVAHVVNPVQTALEPQKPLPAVADEKQKQLVLSLQLIKPPHF